MKNQTGLNHVKTHPGEFFTYLKNNRYSVFYRSPIFFRDFQFGLWRYLKSNKVWFPYSDIEKIAREVIDDYEARGVVRKINPMNYELQMPEFITPPPPEPAPAAKQVAPAPVAATQGDAPAPAPASIDDKAAKLAELQAKMAAAKAAKEGGAAPAAAPSAPAPQAALGADDEKARKIAELQAKMAAAKAAKEGSNAPGPAPTTPDPVISPVAPAIAAAPASAVDDEKARKLAELKAKMEEAKRKREAGE